jgi:tellurite resistance protein TerC
MQTTNASPEQWLLLIIGIGVLLVLDFFVIRSRGGEMSFRGAAIASIFWVGVALAFFGITVLTEGAAAGETFLAGYLIEKSLSLDNVFIFLLILNSFAIPANQRHRLLTFGITAALVMRAVFIVVGSAALAAFGWISIPFALIVLWTGVRLWQHRHDHDGEQKLVEGIQERLNISGSPNSKKLLIKSRTGRVLTPAGGALVAILLADLLFAVDSVPAILAITTDTYIVWATNAFALLGLRPLFFLVAELVERLYYLKAALALLLIFVGFKLGLSEFIGKVSPSISLGVIGSILAIGVVASLVRNRRLAIG